MPPLHCIWHLFSKLKTIAEHLSRSIWGKRQVPVSTRNRTAESESMSTAADRKRAELKKRRKKGRRAVSTKLKAAADLLLRREGRSVIDRLADQCREGEIQSAKLLLEMAQGSHMAEGD